MYQNPITTIFAEQASINQLFSGTVWAPGFLPITTWKRDQHLSICALCVDKTELQMQDWWISFFVSVQDFDGGCCYADRREDHMYAILQHEDERMLWNQFVRFSKGLCQKQSWENGQGSDSFALEAACWRQHLQPWCFTGEKGCMVILRIGLWGCRHLNTDCMALMDSGTLTWGSHKLGGLNRFSFDDCQEQRAFGGPHARGSQKALWLEEECRLQPFDLGRVRD